MTVARAANGPSPSGIRAAAARTDTSNRVEAGMRRPDRLMLLACLALPAMAQRPEALSPQSSAPPATDRLLVCNKAEDTVSIMAVADRREVAVLKTGEGPHEVAVGPDGRTAAITNYGNQKPGHTLTIIDVVTKKVVRTIDLKQPTELGGDDNKRFLRPHGVQFVSKDQVIVTSEAARLLVRVHVRTGAIERVWSTAQPSMHMVSATPDGKHAAGSSIVDGTVMFFDLTKAKSPTGNAPPQNAPPRNTPIPTGKGAEGLAVHPSTGDAWVANREQNTLAIVSRKSGKISKTLTTGEVPFRVAFSNDGKQALVTCAESGELQVFDVQRRKLVREISMHGDRSEQSSLPLGVVCGPDNRFAYVTCARGEFVAVIDLQKGEYIDRIDARKGPDGIAYARPTTNDLRR